MPEQKLVVPALPSAGKRPSVAVRPGVLDAGLPSGGMSDARVGAADVVPHGTGGALRGFGSARRHVNGNRPPGVRSVRHESSYFNAAGWLAAGEFSAEPACSSTPHPVIWVISLEARRKQP